jgi:transposase
LEDAFAVLLINMPDLRHVPGHNSDVRDSEWLAQLLECGALRAANRPAFGLLIAWSLELL